MRRLMVVSAALLLMLAWPWPASAGLQGSPHDFSDDELGIAELCKFCHIPHNAEGSTAAPLWNRSAPAETFTFYDGSTGPATGASALCLSCHDGITNIDAVSGSSGTMTLGAKFPGTTAVIGTNLQDDHPVAIIYESAETQMKTLDENAPVKLFNGKVECASCHNPHSNQNSKLLRISNARSALCLTCHDK